MFSCNNYNRNYQMCNLQLGSVLFQSNRAGFEGGAFKWNFYEPIMNMSTLTFVNNKAGIYGNNFAAVA